MKKFICGLAVTCLLVSCSDDNSATATIDGSVSENVIGWKGDRTYLGGVKVTLSGNGVKTLTKTTDATGRYAFYGLEVGSYTLTFSNDNYVAADTTVNLFKLEPYTVSKTMKYNFDNANATWSSDGLTLSLLSGNFTLKNGTTTLYSGQYACNAAATLLTFHSITPEATFEADYLGGGSMYLFTPAAIDGKSRFCFYKN